MRAGSFIPNVIRRLVEFGSDDGSKDRYVLQRINEAVFPDPRAVMRNVEVVTCHINWKILRVKRDLSGQTLNLFPARGGRFNAEGLRRWDLAVLQLH